MEHNKIIKDNIKEDNYKVFALLRQYLNHLTLLDKTQEPDRRGGRFLGFGVK